MKTKLLLSLLLTSSVFLFSCGDKCWKCKTWTLQGNGIWQYTGEIELCEVTTKQVNSTIDFLKNDSTDGWECEVFYK